MSDLAAFLAARLDEDEDAANKASGGTVVGEPGNWQPAPGGDEWEVHSHLAGGDHGPDGDLELLVALRPGLPRPPEVMGGYWGSVISWQKDHADRDAWVPEPALRHAARHDPARVLREVEAKRNILALHQPGGERAGLDWIGRQCRYCGHLWPCDEARAIASVWSDHPDYDQAWAPATGAA